jgi:tol-pal system protein YbgF
MKRRTPLWSTLLALLLTAGCASTGSRAGDAAANEAAELKERIVELQRRAAMNEVEMARMRQQIADLESGKGGAASSPTSPPRTTPAVKPPAAVAPRPDPAPRRAEVVPAEPIEEVDIEIPEQGIKPPPKTPTLASRLATAPPSTPPAATVRPAPAPAVPLASQPPAPAQPTPTLTPAPMAPGGDDPSSPAAIQALYDRGYTLYHQGHFVDSETSFQRYLQASPNSELSDNAQYWIGECRYSRGDLKGALAAFRETVQRFPQGNKVPDALLKAGQSLEGTGDREGARQSYQEILKRFSGTAAAAVAEERLAKLR